VLTAAQVHAPAACCLRLRHICQTAFSTHCVVGSRLRRFLNEKEAASLHGGYTACRCQLLLAIRPVLLAPPAVPWCIGVQHQVLLKAGSIVDVFCLLLLWLYCYVEEIPVPAF
jgi:hypothetical protein